MFVPPQSANRFQGYFVVNKILDGQVKKLHVFAYTPIYESEKASTNPQPITFRADREPRTLRGDLARLLQPTIPYLSDVIIKVPDKYDDKLTKVFREHAELRTDQWDRLENYNPLKVFPR